MNMDGFMEFLQSVSWQGSRLGLERMTCLMKLLGDPQKKLKFVHVAGTNGKGSLTALVSSVLTAAGYKTGVYTSPHLVSYCERMVVDGAEIPERELFALAEEVKPLVEQMEDKPTEFELLTGMALLYFAQQGCDIVLLEVGLGGRLDATNVIDAPEAAVIMNIGLDHTGILGDTLEKIAGEKAGIIKEGCAVVAYPGQPEVEAVYRRVCAERHAALRKADLSRLTFVREDLFGQTFHWGDLHDLTIGLLGEHQRRNAAVALETIEVLREKGWSISDEAIRTGLEAARWPARLEVLCREPLFILDGAHNGQCAQALADSLKSLLPGQKIVFLTGVLADKDYRDIMGLMMPMASEFFCLTPFSERALPAAELAACLTQWGAKATPCETVEEGIGAALAAAGEKGIVVSFGSLYLAGAVRDAFLN